MDVVYSWRRCTHRTGNFFTASQRKNTKLIYSRSVDDEDVTDMFFHPVNSPEVSYVFLRNESRSQADFFFSSECQFCLDFFILN